MTLGIGISKAPIPGEANGMTTLLNPLFYSSIGQGTWSFYTENLSQWFGSWRNASAADGDNISYKVYLTAGTYIFHLIGKKFSSAGIMDLDIDAAEVGSIDLYNASTIYNQISTIAAITVAESGLKTVRLRVDGKNGSSSGYLLDMHNFQFSRTA